MDYNKLRHLEVVLQRRVEGLGQGEIAGNKSGHGSEVGEARLYEAGDDVRRIDWALLARTGDTYVRDIIADHEVTTAVLCDLSPSMRTGTRGDTRISIALQTVAAFGFLMARGSNRFGVYGMFADRENWWKPKPGRDYIAAVIHQISQMEEEAKVSFKDEDSSLSLGQGIYRIARLATRKGVALVVSDFLDKDWQRPLSALSHVHETICVRIVDPLDMELPNIGVVDIEDPETHAQLRLDTSSAAVRKKYFEAAKARQENISSKIVSAGAEEWLLNTREDITQQLITLVTDRKRRMRFGHAS